MSQPDTAERILDAATYLNRFFTEEEKRTLGEALLRQLLHFPWPGGYVELQKTLGSIRSQLAEGIQPTPQVLNELLSSNSGDPHVLEGSLDLGGFLKRRQGEYLILHREGDEDFKDTLLRLGIDNKDLDIEGILKNEVLVYPDLIDNNPAKI